MIIMTYYTDSPSGSWSSWFLSTDSSCRVGAQDTHPRLLQGLMRCRGWPLTRRPPRFLSMQRDKRVILLFPSHTTLRLRCGRPSATESRRLWDRSSSVTESWMCCGTKERPEEEQFNSGAIWQVQGSGQVVRGETQRCPEEARSSTTAKNGPCATAITTCPEGTDRSSLQLDHSKKRYIFNP